MADSQHVVGRRQHRQRRRTAASETHDWEPRRDESRHSVPYPTRQPEIQRSDRRRPKHASQRPRASEDFLDTRSMPPPVRILARSSTPKSRGRRGYDDRDGDDNGDDSEKERLRGRLRSRSRPALGMRSRATSAAKSRVKSRPTSLDSHSSDSIVHTPTRSSYIHISPPSAPSLGSSSGSSSDDSDDESSDSAQDFQAKTRTLKERMNGTPDSEPFPNITDHSRSRQPSRERLVPEIESPTEDSDEQVVSHRPRVVVKRSSISRRRQAHQSRSPSRAPPHPRHTHQHSEEYANFSPKRAQKKYYHSDMSYSGKPSFSRSRATSMSRVTSPHSISSSSKQSHGHFFKTSALPQPHGEDSSIRTCIACGDGKSAKKLAKLKCGHRWCRSCLKRRFRVSIEDAQNMPPRCCNSDIIPLKHVNDLFNDDFKTTWNEKFARFSARGRNHCPRAKCREWIRPEDHRYHTNGRTSATCRKCETEICGVCYNKWHDSKHCPTDEGTAQFLKVAKEAGWKRCFNCKAMVELKEGCNHMTCRCGAQFCMICGSKWKACECPSFNYDLDEEDAFDHVQIPAPMVSRERLGGTDGLPRSLRPGLSYAHATRRHRGHRDEDLARRLQHPDEDEDEEDDDDDDYLHDMGDMMGLGNGAGHFLNHDYRRRSQSTIVPQVPPPAVPLPPASVTLERPKSGANYVSGVKKARGVRASSMERRLADRFSGQRQSFKPHHPFGQPLALPTAPPLGMVPPLHQPPMVPSPISRRHTMDDDMYDIPFDPRYGPPSMPPRSATHGYMGDFAVHPPMGRRRYRQMEPPRPSALAGLTGPGSGMNRVFEWMNHVDAYPPDSQTVA